MSPRSYYAGRRASASEPTSRVRVYERADRDGIYMSRAWVTTPSGRPVEARLPSGMTWEAAETLADLTASERRKAILAGRNDFGEAEVVSITLRDLFKRYLASETAKEWGVQHRGDVERSLDFWRGQLDIDRDPMSLTPAEVRKLAGDAARQAGWGPRWVRKKIKQLQAAVRWGKVDAKLYRFDPLEGTKLPDYAPETDHLIYTEAETRKLLESRPEVDWRVTLACNIAADTGRRINSIRQIHREDVAVAGERVFLHFRAEADKSKKGAWVPVSAQTAELLAQALEHDLVEEWGWIFPGGRLDWDDPRDRPLTRDRFIKALHKAEGVVGVEEVTGRAFHGLKRRHVTTAMEVAQGDTSLVGDITGNASAELLRKTYRKNNQRRSSSHVDAVRQALETAEDTPDDTPTGGNENAPPPGAQQ